MQVELQVELLRRYPKFFRKPGKRLVNPEVISELEKRLQDDRPRLMSAASNVATAGLP